jgi:hypothetical protein
MVIYLATQWIHGVGGGQCGAWSVGRGYRLKQRVRGWALWGSVGQQGLSVGTVTTITVVLGRHSGVRVTYIDCSLLVAADVSQLIQRMIGIGWLRSADTNNHIFAIACAMPPDTNNPRL